MSHQTQTPYPTTCYNYGSRSEISSSSAINFNQIMFSPESTTKSSLQRLDSVDPRITQFCRPPTITLRKSSLLPSNQVSTPQPQLSSRTVTSPIIHDVYNNTSIPSITPPPPKIKIRHYIPHQPDPELFSPSTDPSIIHQQLSIVGECLLENTGHNSIAKALLPLCYDFRFDTTLNSKPILYGYNAHDKIWKHYDLKHLDIYYW